MADADKVKGEEICTTYHYGVLFKVLALIPKILTKCPVPYVVGGGTAIVTYLKANGIKPKITDKWDSYDWDVYTTDIVAMKDYIVKSLTKNALPLTIANPDELARPVINVAEITHKGKSGYQLSLDVCYRIEIPSSLNPDRDVVYDHDSNKIYKLQFMDIFQADDDYIKIGPFPLIGAFKDIIKMNDVWYYTPEKMLKKLNEAIVDRSVGSRSLITELNFEGATNKKVKELAKSKKMFNKVRKEYLSLLERKAALANVDVYGPTGRMLADNIRETEIQLTEAVEDLYVHYETVMLEHFSYRNVAHYIRLKVEIREEMDKLQKMRKRSELLTSLFKYIKHKQAEQAKQAQQAKQSKEKSAKAKQAQQAKQVQQSKETSAKAKQVKKKAKTFIIYEN